jgi:hypothetical protein
MRGLSGFSRICLKEIRENPRKSAKSASHFLVFKQLLNKLVKNKTVKK